jgi:O-antigen/teichoic acid export membrane protein
MRGAALLAIRQGLVSLVTLVGVVALSVLLEPSDFALYGYVTTVILVAAAVGDLGLGASLIKGEPSDEQLRGSLALQLSVWVPFCILGGAAGAALGVYGFSPATAVLLFAALLLLCLQTMPTALLERRMAFGSVATVETAQRVVFVACAIALAAVAPRQWSIPLALLVSALVSLPATVFLARWHWTPRFARGEPLFRGFSSHWWQSRIANQLSYAAYPLLGGILFTAHQVGLMVWALAITSVPALLAPTIARAVFPAIARTDEAHQVPVYRQLFRGLLVLAVPCVAALFSCAEPLTRYFFGDKWLEAVLLLRLESITTFLGLALTPIVPLLFLAIEPRRVKWLMVLGTAAVWALAPIVAIAASFKAISITQIAVAVALLGAIDVILRRRRSYSPIVDMLPGLAGLVVAVAICWPLAETAGNAAVTIAIGLAAAAIQLGVTVLLGGGVDPRPILRRPQGDPGGDLVPDDIEPPELLARSAPPAGGGSD